MKTPFSKQQTDYTPTNDDRNEIWSAYLAEFLVETFYTKDSAQQAILACRNWPSSVSWIYRTNYVLIQTHKKFRRTLIYYDTATQSANFGQIPFVKPQNNTYTTDKQLKMMKNERETYLFLVEMLFACPVLGRLLAWQSLTKKDKFLSHFLSF